MLTEEDFKSFEQIIGVINGRISGCVMRNFLDKDVCLLLRNRFIGSTSLQSRNDSVPAYYVGTYHYRKKLETYLDEAERCRPLLFSLFAEANDIFLSIIFGLTQSLRKEGISLRIARHGTRLACPFLMRSWSNEEEYSLRPHDDISQLYDPCQAGFEIQNTVSYPLIAVNVCINNESGGDLVYWDCQPDLQMRRELGVEFTGFPYPIEALSDFKRQIVPIRTGDIYFFNGKNVHGVLGGSSKTIGRITLSFFMGFIDESTMIYWA